MDPKLGRVQTPCEIYIERLKVRRGQVPIFVYIVLEEGRRRADTGVGEDVVDLAVVLFCGFESWCDGQWGVDCVGRLGVGTVGPAVSNPGRRLS